MAHSEQKMDRDSIQTIGPSQLQETGIRTRREISRMKTKKTTLLA